MAFSSTNTLGDGVTTDFNVPFDYLDKSHVYVKVDKVDTLDPASLFDFEWINESTVRVRKTVNNSAPQTGADVVIERRTPISTPAVVFGGGAALSTENLNKSSLYLTFALQEATDTDERFSKVYLGSHVTNPSTDNEGLPLIPGAVYFNTVSEALFYYTGTDWIVGESVSLCQSALAAAQDAALDSAQSATQSFDSATSAAASVNYVSALVQVVRDLIEQVIDPAVTDVNERSVVATQAAASAGTSASQAAASASAAAATLSASDLALIDPDTRVYLQAIGVTPSADQSLILNSTILRLKMAGIWNELDMLHLDLGISEQAALVNIKNPSILAINNGTTYIAGEGFQGNGTDAWINTAMYRVNLTNYSTNSAHLGLYVTNSSPDSGRDMGFTDSLDAFIETRTASNNFLGRVNSSVAMATTVTTGLGLSVVSRDVDDTVQQYKDGVYLRETTSAWLPIPEGFISVLRSTSDYSSKRVWAWTAGAHLNAARQEALYEILSDARNGIAVSQSGMLTLLRDRVAVQTATITSGNLTVDLRNGHNVVVPLTTGITNVNVTNWPLTTTTIRFSLTQDATGGRDVTWPASWITEASAPAPQPAIAANSVTEVFATSFDGGTTVRMASGGVWSA